jgi:dTDP-4-amino-4,6-dideoxygalactose transaminase
VTTTVHVSDEHGLSPAILARPPRPEPLPFPLSAPGRLDFYRARNAIYHLFRALGFADGATVLAPDYHNSNEVLPMRAAGANVVFYRIGRNLEPDFEQLAHLARVHAPRALFVIHYFGWAQPLKELMRLCEERGMLLVEDCAQATLSETAGRPLGSFGHYATFCLYKTLPIPNGGVLVENGPPLPALRDVRLRPCGVAPLAGRTLELVLEWLRTRSYAVGEAAFAAKQAVGRTLRRGGGPHVPFGDIGFDVSTADLAMSDFSWTILRRLDYAEIRRRRRENFVLLRERLEGHATLWVKEVEEGMCPYVFPILVRDKQAAVHALRARGIEAEEFWNHGVPDARGRGFEDSDFLHDHVMELPIHHDVTPAQVERIAAEVIRLGVAL